MSGRVGEQAREREDERLRSDAWKTESKIRITSEREKPKDDVHS